MADIKLPQIIGSNMVLQQKTTIKVWGWGDSGEKITLTANWQKNKLSTTTGSDGKWYIDLETIEGGGPYQIVLKGKNTITLDNILLGEVWLCSGQSNMRQPLSGYFGQPTLGANATIINSSNVTIQSSIKK